MTTTLSRLAFTTLGFPGAPLSEVAALAARSGWRGVEVRSADDEPVHTGLGAEARTRARRELSGVTLLATNTYVRLGSGLADEQVVEHLLSEARLAADLGAPAIRVFPGADHARGGDDRTDVDAVMVDRLRASLTRLPAGVDIWLETHDSHRTGAAIAAVLAQVDDPRVGAIWDVAHPLAAGEDWATTLEQLRPHLAHVQVKDQAPGRIPLPLGEGDVPVADIVRALEADGYRGWYSLEYELKWHPDAPPLEEALRRSTRWWRAQGL